jgi:hypothetical protein
MPKTPHEQRQVPPKPIIYLANPVRRPAGLLFITFFLWANSLYATVKYIHSLYATCHRHQKIYLYATQWHTRDEYKI